MLVAICTPLLLALSALAVDVANWYAQASRIQNAVDAAALAGVVFLPDDPAKAEETAIAVADRNLSRYVATADEPDRPILEYEIDARPVTGKPSQLRVTISATVQNGFARLLGQPTTTITRTSIADYAGTIPIGGPCNVLGNEPTPQKGSSACLADPRLWMAVAGPAEPKQNGDRFHAGTCFPASDRCLPPNIDYEDDGYVYVLRVRDPGRVLIESYDPALIPVPAAACTDPSTCPSDGGPGVGAPTTPATTSFIVRGPYEQAAPDQTPVIDTAECSPTQFPGSTGFDAADPDQVAWSQQWVTLCELQVDQPGEYLVQVRTNVPFGADPTDPDSVDPALAAGGINRYALRASYDFVGADNSPLSLFALEKMAIFANDITLSDARFYLARIPSGSAGKQLKVELFDIGDGAGTGSITVLPPEEALDGGAPLNTFSDCDGSGVVNGPIASCRLTPVTSRTFQGRLQTIEIDIPEQYSCDDDDPVGCWTRIEYMFDTGEANDTTSWTARLLGDPVRIVQ